MIRLLINERLAERGMTQVELSNTTGIRAATINDMCRNLNSLVNLDYIELICRALDCDLCDVMTMHYDELKAIERIIRHGDIHGAYKNYIKKSGESAQSLMDKLNKSAPESRELVLLFARELVTAEERKHL